MKPILLYTMPRSRGTAGLYRCKTYEKLNEPFMRKLSNKFDNSSWDLLVEKMNSIDTCTKIHGSNMEFYKPGNKWYNEVLNLRSHEIFVIERKDRLNMLLSDILAKQYGYTSLYENEQKTYFTATDNDIHRSKMNVLLHLKYFPYYGKIITYETLPDNHFDLNTELKNHIDQQSHLKYHYITNLEWCKNELQTKVLDFYKSEWDDKILSLDSNWNF
jgi:hypothetical protein